LIEVDGVTEAVAREIVAAGGDEAADQTKFISRHKSDRRCYEAVRIQKSKMRRWWNWRLGRDLRQELFNLRLQQRAASWKNGASARFAQGHCAHRDADFQYGRKAGN